MSKLIYVDPGHGGKDPGAVSEHARESDILYSGNSHMLGISERVVHHINALGHKAVLTRTNEPVKLSQIRRQRTAIQAEADAYLSLHVNAADPRASGLECWIPEGFPHHEYMWATELAIRVKSDPTLQGHRIRKCQHACVDLIDRNSPRNRVYNCIGLTAEHMPSMLVEIGFVTNEIDRSRLTNRYWREAMAMAIVASTIRYLHT